MSSTSIIEINQNSIEHNINFLRNHFGKNVKISSVVKGNAYGHGVEVIVPIIQSCEINHFSVFSSCEARCVHKVINRSNKMMIMGFIADEDFEWVIENDIEFYISDLYRAEKALNISQKLKKKALIHIDIETRMDMVRIGIMQYGFWPSKETLIHYIHNRKEKKDPLKRAINWKSKVMSIKIIKQGEFIGYGNNFLALSDMKIVVIPVGYSDGFSRSLSNQGIVLINGKRVSIIGIVDMNMIIANVSKLPKVKINDEVVLVGKQGSQNLSVASFEQLSNQVNYELLTRLPQNIERIKTI